jgi:hypothetical protein
MLHEFLIANRNELIERCRQKMATRFEPSPFPDDLEHGIPLLLNQIADALRLEHPATGDYPPAAKMPPMDTEIGPMADLHGAAMLRAGYSIDQVVHEYGDFCQSVTELAIESGAAISTDEFRILNRCLDNAIAGAVKSFGQEGRLQREVRAQGLHERLHLFSDQQRRLVDIAIHSFSAIRTGDVGLNGATGALLMHSLNELHALAERTLPQIELLSDATTIS